MHICAYKTISITLNIYKHTHFTKKHMYICIRLMDQRNKNDKIKSVNIYIIITLFHIVFIIPGGPAA